MHRQLIAVLLCSGLIFACGDDDGGGSVDSAGGGDGGGGTIDSGPGTPDSNTTSADGSGTSICGNPGDPGNDMGVGKYCLNATSGECASQPASICANIGDADAHFCTKICNDAMPDEDQCGADATCICQGSGGLCGCTPNSCLGG